jgi:hypothetical protein
MLHNYLPHISKVAPAAIAEEPLKVKFKTLTWLLSFLENTPKELSIELEIIAEKVPWG